MRKGILILAVICGLLGYSIQASAQEGKIRLGKLNVVPGLAVEESYDSNILLGNGTNNTDELKVSDYITHIKPSIAFNYGLNDRGSVTLGYSGDFAYYADRDENDWKNHDVLFGLDYKAPAGFILGIANNYINAEDPYSSDTNYKLGLPQSKRWSNDLKNKVGYDFGNKFRIFGYYDKFKQDYDSDEDYTQDYKQNEYGAGIELRILPKTWGFVRYYYGDKNFYTHPAGTGSTEANDADSDWQRVNAGLTWDATAKLTGELNFGYQWKEYDNLVDSTGASYEDRNTWIAATALSYKFTSTTTLGMNLSRALVDSYSNTKESYKDTGIGLSLRQVLMTKFTLSAGGSYNKNDYNIPVNTPRDDDNYKANIGLDYKIKDWLTAGTRYAYNKKDSNYVENDYTDNIVLISLSAMY